MANFLESASDALLNKWCALSTNDIVLGGLLAAGSTGALPVLAIAGAAGVARANSDRLCNKSSPSPTFAPPTPPFSGGQCPIPYNISGMASVIDVATGTTVEPNFPFSGVNIMGAISFVGVNPANNRQIIAIGGSGTSVLSTLTLSSQAFSSASASSVVPSGGGADTCGDLPTEVEPIPEWDDSIDVDFEDDDGNPVNFPDLPVKFFPPCISLEGIKVPFEVETPLGKLCGQVGLKPALKGGAKPTVDFDLCPSERQDLEQTLPEEVEDYFDLSPVIGGYESGFPSSDYGSTPTFQAEIDKPIMGVFVKCGTDGTEKGKATLVYGEGQSPTLTIPRLGSVRFWMLIEGEDDATGEWSQPIDIRQTVAFIPCPWQFGALAVDIEMADGYDVQYKLALRKNCCEKCKNVDPNAPSDSLDRCD